jgi:hypothetical protein
MVNEDQQSMEPNAFQSIDFNSQRPQQQQHNIQHNEIIAENQKQSENEAYDRRIPHQRNQYQIKSTIGDNSKENKSTKSKPNRLPANSNNPTANENLETMVREWGERNALANNLPAGSVAEVFKIVNTN